MDDKKYNKVLTAILIIVVAGIIVVGTMWGIRISKSSISQRELDSAVNEFDQRHPVIMMNNTKQNTVTDTNYVPELMPDANIVTTNETGNTTKAKQIYKGFTVAGKIEIPRTGLTTVVLDRATKSSMEASVGIAYGPGLNVVGNTVILGHNYRNGKFFSNNKNIKEGDAIYITDAETSTRIKYTVYNTYIASSDDFDYATRDTMGKREISLSTCTDDVQSRLIIWARED